ncbi:MAG: hypothetical protein HQ541_15385 [Mariniphaga sp.]|nr:hypothetical protein [Mariniphaga sp.]
MKRIIVATLLGMVFGVVCYYFAKSGGGEIPAALRYQIIGSRALIGFAIGISCLNLKHWSLHGLVLGLIFSIPLSFSGMMAENPDFSGEMMFASTMIMGGIYGILIELITSVLLKLKQK